MRSLPRALRLATLLTAGAVLLTACGGGDGNTADTGAPDGAADGYPVTLENCGRTVTVESAPNQAVSLDQGSTEILLSLGLADRLAATATWTDPVMKGLEKANASVPRIAENRPSSEKVLDLEPDFVSASFESTLGKGGVAPREQFEELGVPTYVAPADCTAKDLSLIH
ncbi:ABC transporter substrate-binding protein, partial [Streptomyces sp. NRRL WC-3549]|uniref:ABC transporter substrate-binding protein n=1 Tax=Streptomyces sp. NRRL WC-3549 TaxID=1463925 RepID=UPI00131D91F6